MDTNVCALKRNHLSGPNHCNVEVNKKRSSGKPVFWDLAEHTPARLTFCPGDE